MKLVELFDQSLQAIQTSESLLQEYDAFSRMYTIDNDEYFEDRLIKMGYSNDDVSSILINKDLLLSGYSGQARAQKEVEADRKDTRHHARYGC